MAGALFQPMAAKPKPSPDSCDVNVNSGGAPRAVWSALPGTAGERWPDAIAQAVAACVLGGRGALVVVPDARDIDRVLAALADAGIPRWTPSTRGGAVRLAADDGPAVRYRSFLAALRGQASVVVGTRAGDAQEN